MFDNLSDRLSGILDTLTRRGALTDADVDVAMREVRRALLEADVALDVTRAFVDQVKQQAIGIDVIKSVTPGQMVVKIVHDELIETLGAQAEPIDLNAPSPVPIMLVGLQGSGKTTTAAKIAKRLTEQGRRKVLMASLDVYRPAAMEQLAVLGQQITVETLPIVVGQQPAQIAQRALQAARLGGYDVVLLDTAGRTTLDDAMMAEAAEVKRAANPHEMLLVADALTGQDAVNLARAFDERVGLTGIVLTRIDGDGRGGAALSMRAVTGKPIKLIGVGEKIDALEDFHPSRIADRILGMGDIVSLVEKAAATIDAEKAARVAEKMRKGQFDLEDLREQLLQMAQMGGLDRPDGHAAGRRQDEEPVGRREPRREGAQAPGRDHRFDDAEGAPAPGPSQGEPQEAHRGGLGREGRGHQPYAQDAPLHVRRHEGDGLGQARADGGARQHARARRRHAERGADGQARAADAGRHSARSAAAGMAVELPPNFPGLPSKAPGRAAGLPVSAASRPGWRGFPGSGEEEMMRPHGARSVTFEARRPRRLAPQDDGLDRSNESKKSTEKGNRCP